MRTQTLLGESDLLGFDLSGNDLSGIVEAIFRSIISFELLR
jgi:hypothetical protein